MIFAEHLKKYDPVVKKSVNDFFMKAEKNQYAENDILLVYIHGFMDKEHQQSLIKKKISEYVFGPAHEGHCADRFYEFFDLYRRGYIKKDYFDNELKEKKSLVELKERISIDMELLIYLKFWESDLILRQLFNLTNLAQGKRYEWDFDPSKFWKRRELIRREIQEPIKNISPDFYNLIEDTYSAQIRNAIAHSKYFFLGRNLQLANKKDSPHYVLYNVPFDDWTIRFHKVILLYNHMIGNFNRINKKHARKAADKHNGLAIEVPKKNKYGLNQLQWIKYDKKFKRWYYESPKAT